MRLSSLSVVSFSHFSNPPDKVALSLRVGYAVIFMRTGESHFEITIFPSNFWMVNEVIPKQESIPVLKMGLNHVDVMRSVPVFVTFDKPGIERGSIVSP